MDAPEAQSVLVRSTHTHARTHTHTHTSAWGTASLVRIVLSTTAVASYEVTGPRSFFYIQK